MINRSRQGKILVFAFLILSLISPCIVYAASAQSTVVSAEASQNQLKAGDTLTVTIKASNAVDLYGVDVTLSWNTSVLKEISATSSLGVESNPSGVLHESANYPIDVQDDGVTDGEYHLLATSTGASTPSFSGSGTIATLVFNVTGSGSAGLVLDPVELSTRDSAGEISLVSPSTSVSAVTATIPEFPTVALVLALAIAAAAAVIVATKKMGKQRLNLAKNTSQL